MLKCVSTLAELLQSSSTPLSITLGMGAWTLLQIIWPNGFDKCLNMCLVAKILQGLSVRQEMRFPGSSEFLLHMGRWRGGGVDRAGLIFRKWNILSLTAVSRLSREEILV